MNEMIKKAILTAIKEHCANSDKYNDITMYKPVGNYIEMCPSISREFTTKCSSNYKEGVPELYMNSYTVYTKCKAKKYENNIVIWDVKIYSNGDLGIYFDGTKYVKWTSNQRRPRRRRSIKNKGVRTMTIKDLLEHVGSKQKITIVGGFDKYSYHVIVEVTTVSELIKNNSEIELMKICSYSVAKFYAESDIVYITVYEFI